MRLFDCATKNVIYLRELRTALMDHLMAEFTTGVDIYLSVIRDLDQEEICKEKVNLLVFQWKQSLWFQVGVCKFSPRESFLPFFQVPCSIEQTSVFSHCNWQLSHDNMMVVVSYITYIRISLDLFSMPVTSYLSISKDLEGCFE